MKIIYFSKYDQELSIEKLGEKIGKLGFDGIDLAVRPGHPVNPENVNEILPKAQSIWNSQGVEASLVSANFDFLNSNMSEAKQLYGACNEAGIKWIKIGYWKYRRNQNYWEEVDRIREALKGFEKLSKKYKVKTCYHTHSGSFYGSNCAGLTHLIKGFNPEYVGAYVDTGHLVLDGEKYDMGLAMIKDYLSVVGLKDALYAKDEESGEFINKPKFVPLGKGLVPWKEFFTLLVDARYNGPLSIHGEYEVKKQIRDNWIKEDLKFIRGILGRIKDR